MSRVIINVPASARQGETIEIRAMAAHVMETGFRRTQLGEIVPRNIITEFSCNYEGVEIFRARLHPAIAANPMFIFTTVAIKTGVLEFRWSGDNGFSAAASAKLQVN